MNADDGLRGDAPIGDDAPLTVVRELYQASPLDVWRAFEDPAAIEQWWAPGGTVVETAQVELHPGGALRVLSRGRGLTFEVLGTVSAAERLCSFTTTWSWAQADPVLAAGTSGEVTVTLESLSSTAAGTRVTVQHTGLQGEQRQRNAEGWARALEGLQEYLEQA